MGRKLTALEKRCEDCIAVISKGGIMCCDEKWGKPCNEVEDCPEGIEIGEIEEIAEKAKSIKVEHGAKDENHSSKKSVAERKIDVEKTHLIKILAKFLNDLEYIEDLNVTNPSKNIEFKLGDDVYKLDLVRRRAKK